MKYLGYKQALFVYRRVLEETGGAAGLRDEGGLRSALARPQASFGGKDLYPALFEKAAALAESLARNHPFVDGNKRMALACMRVLLKINGFQVTASQEAKVSLILQIVEHKLTVEEAAKWLTKHTKKL